MNKDYYKKAFSAVRPSENAVERIYDMTQKKHVKLWKKSVLAVAIVLAVLLCGSVTANAATKGALFEGMRLIVNGEDVDLKDYIVHYDSYTDEDGAEVEEYEFSLPEDEEVGAGSVEIYRYNEESDGGFSLDMDSSGRYNATE